MWWCSGAQKTVSRFHFGCTTTTTTTTTVLWPLYRTTCISQHPQLWTGRFCWSKVLCRHALADDSWHIQIREKILEFSSSPQWCYLHRLHTSCTISIPWQSGMRHTSKSQQACWLLSHPTLETCTISIPAAPSLYPLSFLPRELCYRDLRSRYFVCPSVCLSVHLSVCLSVTRMLCD